MTVVVILFLVVLWAIVLGPSIYRRWSEGRVSDSVSAFSSHLRTLRRTGPAPLAATSYYVEPEMPAAFASLPPPASTVPAVRILRGGRDSVEEAGPAEPRRAVDPRRVIDVEDRDFGPRGIYDYSSPEGYIGGGTDDGEAWGDAPVPGLGDPSGWSRAAAVRAETLRRRRDTLLVLGVSFVGCLALGAVGALRPLWYLAVLIAAALAGYVALLVRFERNAAERRMKVSVLPQATARTMRASRYVTVGASDGFHGEFLDEADEAVVVVRAVGGA